MFLLLPLVSACNPNGDGRVPPRDTVSLPWSPSLTSSPISPSATFSSSPTFSPSPTITLSPSPSPTASPLPTLTPTPDPYAEYTIAYLSWREYGGGQLEIVETLDENIYFTRYLVRYPSDDLTIYGFLDLPQGEGPFPVIIAIHGYIEPEIYDTIDYTTRYADALARAGYLVIHPNLRNYPPSDSGENLFRVGMAIDILNLIALVAQRAGQPGPLQAADATRLGLWGHSMGGGIATRVITVNPTSQPDGEPLVDAAVLYAAMSGDEVQNFEAIYRWSDGARGEEELNAPPEALQRISPVYHFERIQAAVSIHHGRDDQLVPLRWSRETCETLIALGKEVECYYYKHMPHTFYGEGEVQFITNVLSFFNRTLR